MLIVDQLVGLDVQPPDAAAHGCYPQVSLIVRAKVVNPAVVQLLDKFHLSAPGIFSDESDIRTSIDVPLIVLDDAEDTEVVAHAHLLENFAESQLLVVEQGNDILEHRVAQSLAGFEKSEGDVG